jgi:hypothetical protein
MKRVLMVSPHFPPDTSAGAHRVRLLAPHLPRYGWEPTIVTVDPRDYEGRLDPALAGLLPSNLRIVRCRAWPAWWTRRIGLGDLGLRAFQGLLHTCSQLMQKENFKAVFITIFPSYPALLGPILKRRFGVPFILDYQDPWIGAWGKTVGGGPRGRPDLKSRLSRIVATGLEPRVVRVADAITAVSAETYEGVRVRNPALGMTHCTAIPLGGEAADFERIRAPAVPNGYFEADDGQCHLCYVGTLLPLGFETLRAVLQAIVLLQQRRPQQYHRLRLHFFGTSNQTAAGAPQRVLPIAQEFGVAERITEIPSRIDYVDALRVLTQGTAILMLGSSERHYTASKLYPGLLARRSILAIYHEASSVVDILRKTTGPPTVRLVTYDDVERAESRVEAIYAHLSGIAENPVYDAGKVDWEAVAEFSAKRLTGKLAEVLEQVANR